jgi:hypothetical protein
MSTPRYDFMNPPNVTEGPDALWTEKQREAWKAAYAKDNYIPNGIDGRSRVTNAVAKFEESLWEFAYGSGWQAPEYIDWIRLIGFELAGCCQELPTTTLRHQPSWRNWRDDVVEQYTADMSNPNNWDAPLPIGGDEVKAALWACTLTPYRIWQVMDDCRIAGVAATEESLLEMANDCETRDVKRAVRRAMETAVAALDAEFTATRT